MGHAPKNQHKEIIEIGITTVDFFTKEIVKSRSIIVKPEFSKISAFCTKLTTITPELVETEGIPFKDACDVLVNEFNSEKRMWFSWGNYDRISIEQESKLKKIKYPLSKTHIDLSTLYAFKFGLKQIPSVTTALDRLGLEFEGVLHRGVSDAYNTARILQKII